LLFRSNFLSPSLTHALVCGASGCCVRWPPSLVLSTADGKVWATAWRFFRDAFGRVSHFPLGRACMHRWRPTRSAKTTARLMKRASATFPVPTRPRERRRAAPRGGMQWWAGAMQQGGGEIGGRSGLCSGEVFSLDAAAACLVSGACIVLLFLVFLLCTSEMTEHELAGQGCCSETPGM